MRLTHPAKMISVIVSKYHPTQIEILKKNIADTINVPHEIIVIENGEGKMGLCEVYNKGAQMARYKILCYSHEDLEIMSPGWGSAVLGLFESNVKLGLLGLAGTGYKPNSPSGWWYPEADPRTMFSNYIQGNKVNDKGVTHYCNPSNAKLSPVVCLDGFWFCTPRQIALALKFDDSTFTGFHCYDIDYSLSVIEHYEVAVTYEILIKHFSEGTGSVREWIKDSLKLYKKWKNRLPFDVTHLDTKHRRREEIKALKYFLQEMLYNGYSMREIYQELWSLKARSTLGMAALFRVNMAVGWQKILQMTRGLTMKVQQGSAKTA